MLFHMRVNVVIIHILCMVQYRKGGREAGAGGQLLGQLEDSGVRSVQTDGGVRRARPPTTAFFFFSSLADRIWCGRAAAPLLALRVSHHLADTAGAAIQAYDFKGESGLVS
jgi:hypothetical protein